MSKAATSSILLVDDDEVVLTLPDVAWHTRIDAAFNTAALRRSVKAARACPALMPTPSLRSPQ